MKISHLLFIATFVLSCKKQKPDVPNAEALYRIRITMNWEGPNLGVPTGAHVTGLAGIIHAKDTFLWTPSQLATPGLEDLAETGNTLRIALESDAILAAGKALSTFLIPPPPVTGTAEARFLFSTDHPCISFASMIAPSPDWFMGIHSLSLHTGNSWITDTTVNLFVYDAGTEEGNMFAYNNPETSPRHNIELLTAVKAEVLANGKPIIAPIGTIRFTKDQD